MEAAELEQIRADLEALRKEVSESDIGGELKLFMLYQLGFILDATDQYKLFGLSPLEHATNESVGALLLNSEVRKRMSGTATGKKFWSLLKRLHLIVAVTRDAGQIFEVVRNLLP